MSSPEDAAPVSPVAPVAPVLPCVSAPERLSAIDVFSGIGGISLGLAPFARSIQYCEWDKYCQSVLFQRMAENRLDRAPIHSDIRNLHISSVVKPTMIFGGFPCQDLSSIGLQRGIVDGEKSKMFYEVMRLVDETPSIEVVFLENVANILSCGIKEVVDECTKRGFTMQWTLRSANAQGAPHVRNRWFLLACRGGGAERVAAVVEGIVAATAESTAAAAATGAPNSGVVEGNSWIGNEPELRVSFRPVARVDETYDDHWSSRCQTLGNAVVPSVVRSAFIDLALASRKWGQYIDLLKETAVPTTDLKYPYPDSSIVAGGQLYALPKRRVAGQKHTVEIVTPGGVKANGEMVKLENYPTPRRGITHASTLTERSVRDLPTILVYCSKTADYIRSVGYEPPAEKALHSMLVPSVNYVEWMMGYPKDWTRLDREGTGGAIPMPLARAAVARARLLQDGEDAEDVEADEGVDGGDGGGGDEGDEGEPTVVKGKAKKAAAKPKAKTAAAKPRLHGMHLYMREHPGKDVPTVAKLWRALTDEEKAVFSERAKAAQVADAVAAPEEPAAAIEQQVLPAPIAV